MSNIFVLARINGNQVFANNSNTELMTSLASAFSTYVGGSMCKWDEKDQILKTKMQTLFLGCLAIMPYQETYEYPEEPPNYVKNVDDVTKKLRTYFESKKKYLNNSIIRYA